jgi:hypothetical protein
LGIFGFSWFDFSSEACQPNSSAALFIYCLQAAFLILAMIFRMISKNVVVFAVYNGIVCNSANDFRVFWPSISIIDFRVKGFFKTSRKDTEKAASHHS